MAGFRKAEPKQAFVKLSMYGPPGSGKTFTALLLAEGLVATSGRRVAFVDTERGSDFYAREVKAREIHPAAFDFDAIYTRSLTEILAACRDLKPKEHGVCILDSITHVWDAAKAAYNGPRNRAGQLPFHAWDKIKRPYKQLMEWVINTPMHVLILGRQGNEFGEDEETGEQKQIGVKMKAEGETAYEPHVCIRMAGVRPKPTAVAVPTAYVEKDRTGVLQGKVIEWPTFDSIGRPLLAVMGYEQGKVQEADDAARQDAETLDREEREKAVRSANLRRTFEAKFGLAADEAGVNAVGKEITPAVKKEMLAADVTALKTAFVAALDRVRGVQGQPAATTTTNNGDGE